MPSLVSVIVPAYNTASRIRYSIESIIAQDYSDIEIIVVDDASQDNTGDIAREVLSSSSRPHKLITHPQNMGECASRNTGIENAEGKYICFIDADDVIHENFVKRLYSAISQGKFDIAFCGFEDKFEDGTRGERYFPRMKSCNDSGENFILGNSVPPVWCCMYGHNFLMSFNLRFHEGCIAGGDVEFITKALCRAEKVISINECLYMYVHHEGMGSIRDNNTLGKKIMRYTSNSGAIERTAQYLQEHAHSERLIKLSENVLLPQSIIRKFTIFAMTKDIAGYNSLRKDEKAMKILRQALSLFTLRRKTEVFVKASMILTVPRMYYRMRAK